MEQGAIRLQLLTFVRIQIVREPILHESMDVSRHVSEETFL